MQASATEPVKPFCGVNVRVVLPVPPMATVTVFGLAVMPKVGAAATVTVTAVEVDVAKFDVAVYVAVMLCAPRDSVDVEYVATPELSVPVPSRVAPS